MAAPTMRRYYLVVYALMMGGTGFVYPLLGLFLTSHIGMSKPSAGWTITALALSSLLAGLACSRQPLLRWSAVNKNLVGLSVQAVGCLMAACSQGPALAVAGLLVLGAGNGIYYATLTPTLISAFGREDLSEMSGLQYAYMNVGMGVGALGTGLALAQLGETAYLVAYAINGGTRLVMLWFVLSRRAEFSGPVEAAVSTSSLPPAGPLSARHLLVLAAQLLVAVFGFTQIDAAVPVVLTESANSPAWPITLLFATNCAAVVIFQKAAIRRVAQHGAGPAIRETSYLWAAAFVVGLAVTALKPDIVGLAILVAVFGIVFALGEVMLAPALQPWIVDHAGTVGIEKFSAVASTVSRSGGLLGPAIGMFSLQWLGGNYYWVGLIVGILVIPVVVAAADARRVPEPVSSSQ